MARDRPTGRKKRSDQTILERFQLSVAWGRVSEQRLWSGLDVYTCIYNTWFHAFMLSYLLARCLNASGPRGMSSGSTVCVSVVLLRCVVEGRRWLN